MFVKIKGWLEKGMSKLPDIAISSGNMWPIYAALYLLFGTILLYIGTWVYFTFWLNKAGLPELKDIILVICGAPLLGSLLALSRRLVDRNGNGIMILTVDEAVQVLKAMRNCLDPLRIKFGGDWRKDEALKMAIERMEVEENAITVHKIKTETIHNG